MKIRQRAVTMAAALSAVALTVQAAGALQFRSLRVRGVPALLQTPHARPLIVEVQSLGCSYCRENIARIAQWWYTAKEGVDMVMVLVDGLGQAEMLSWALTPLARDGKIDVARVPQYTNAEGMSERLRATLDPGWQGEMPRTIILRPDNRRHALNELLTPQILETALED